MVASTSDSGLAHDTRFRIMLRKPRRRGQQAADGLEIHVVSALETTARNIAERLHPGYVVQHITALPPLPDTRSAQRDNGVGGSGTMRWGAYA